MPERSSKSTGRKSRSTTTCGRSRPQATTPSTSSAAASHARTSASPVREPDSLERGPVFGMSSLGSLASYDPATSLWRTSQLSLLEEWEPFSETFPRSGMTRSGTLFRLQPLVRPTAEIESGLWRTPSASEPGVKAERLTSREPGGQARHYDKETGRLAQIGLSQQVQLRQMYPTPSASQMPCEGTVRLARKAWQAGRCTLEEANAIAGRDVRDKQGKVPAMYPTPTVQDASNNGGPSQYERNSLPLNAVAGGALNPTWVEWLMGFPLEWTALDASETPSSRRSSRSSGGRSSRQKKGG
jgi:hypothetical protein